MALKPEGDWSFNGATLFGAEMCCGSVFSLQSFCYISCKLQMQLCFPLGLLCHSLDLFPCSVSTFIYFFPLAVPYTLFCYIHALLPCSPPTHFALSTLWVLQPSACVGSWVPLPKELFHFLSNVAPTEGFFFLLPIFKISCGHLSSTNAKEPMPTCLTPTKSISWQVGWR